MQCSYRRCRLGQLFTSLLIAALLIAYGGEVAAQCSIVDPDPIQTLGVKLDTTSTFTIACTEQCQVNTEVSGLFDTSFEVTPPSIVIPGLGESASFDVDATVLATDGQNARVIITYSCQGGSSSIEIVIDALSQDTIEHKKGGDAVDPVSTRNGELFELYPPDIDLGGPMPLYFQRYYASKLDADGNIDSKLGTNWLHNFSWSLQASTSNVVLRTNRGRAVRFLKSGSNWILSDREDIPFQLSGGPSAGSYTLIDPRDQYIYTFSTSGRLQSVGDANGNLLTLSTSFEPPPVGVLINQISDGFGRTLTFTHQSGQMKSVSDGTRTVSFAQTGDDLTSVTDARGNTTTYVYDAGGLMTSFTRPETNTPFSQTFGAGGEVLSQTDSETNITTFAYVPPNTSITDPEGEVRVHTHTDTGELSNSQDRSGLSVQIAVDAAGRREAITDRLGDTTAFTYDDASGNPSSITHADGTSSALAYTDRVVSALTVRDLTGATRRDGTTEAWSYDAAGNPTSYTNRLGNTATATFNAAGQPLTVTNTAGGTTTLDYFFDGTLDSVQDPAGHTTEVWYDGLKRPTYIYRPDTNLVAFEYDANDNLTSRTDEAGNAVSFGYDLNNNLVSITNAYGSNFLAYDGNDRLVTRTDALGDSRTFDYDVLGRQSDVTDENGNTTSFDYDQLGRLATVTDARLVDTNYTYDAEGVIASVTDRTGAQTLFESDEMGRITKVTTPLLYETDFVYDVMGRLATATNSLGEMTMRSYDAAGRLASITLDEPGVAASFTRGPLGSITQVLDPNGNAWTYANDNQGRHSSSTDPFGQTTDIDYNNRGRPALIDFPDPPETLALSYNGVGNLTQASYSDGTTLAYNYDFANRLESGTGFFTGRDAAGRIVNSNVIIVTRDPGGRIDNLEFTPGVDITYGYDANNNVVSVTDSQGGTTILAYDAEDRLTTITRPNGIVTTQTWDSDGQVVSITEGAISTISLVRDGEGQITAANRDLPLAPGPTSPSLRTYTYDAASQVQGSAYDDKGRLTADGADTFTWDLASRLTNYTVGGNLVEFTYDALGRRISREQDGVTRTYVWNEALALPSVSIERVGGTNDRYYVHLPSGELLYSMDGLNLQRRFYHFDEMGNTLFLTDDGGAVVASYAHSPYGELQSVSGENGNPYTWQGRLGVQDDGNGLYYTRARWYDSQSMRFLSRDPVESLDPREINPYQYARGNPRRYVNPMGETVHLGPYPIANEDNPAPKTSDNSTELSKVGGWLSFPGVYIVRPAFPARHDWKGVEWGGLGGYDYVDSRFSDWARSGTVRRRSTFPGYGRSFTLQGFGTSDEDESFPIDNGLVSDNGLNLETLQLEDGRTSSREATKKLPYLIGPGLVRFGNRDYVYGEFVGRIFFSGSSQ